MIKENHHSKPAEQHDPEALLQIMSFKEEDEKSAKEAFVKFYYQFEDFVKNLVHYIMNKFAEYSEYDKSAMINNVLFLAYQKADTYKPRSKNKKDHANAMNAVRAWLSAIARNEVFLLHREKSRSIDPCDQAYHILHEDNCPIAQDMDEEYLPHPLKKTLTKEFKQASRKVPPSHMKILLIILQTEDEHGVVPQSVRKMIAEKYGMNTVYQRKIKERTINHIKNHVSDEFKMYLIQKSHDNEKNGIIRKKTDSVTENLAKEFRGDDTSESGRGSSFYEETHRISKIRSSND